MAVARQQERKGLLMNMCSEEELCHVQEELVAPDKKLLQRKRLVCRPLRWPTSPSTPISELLEHMKGLVLQIQAAASP